VKRKGKPRFPLEKTQKRKGVRVGELGREILEALLLWAVVIKKKHADSCNQKRGASYGIGVGVYSITSRGGGSYESSPLIEDITRGSSGRKETVHYRTFKEERERARGQRLKKWMRGHARLAPIKMVKRSVERRRD